MANSGNYEALISHDNSLATSQEGKLVLPPLHIKLGLMKRFTKVLQENKSCFQYIKVIFPKIKDAKIKEGIFVGFQIWHF